MDDRAHLERLLSITKQRLQELEAQAAMFGKLYVPPHISMDLDATKAYYHVLHANWEQALPPSTPDSDRVSISTQPFIHPSQDIRGENMTTLPAQISNDNGFRQPTPPLDDDFPCFHIGNLEIPAMLVFGMFGHPLTLSDIDIAYTPTYITEQPDYPTELKAIHPYLLDVHMRTNTTFGAYTDPRPRLDRVEHTPEDAQDNLGKIRLHFSLTNFGQLITTNRSLDCEVIPRSGRVITLREAYCEAPFDDLSISYLANLPGVDVLLISNSPSQTPHKQVLVRQRSNHVYLYPGWYQSSAAGYMSLGHTIAGIPHPFATAVEETKQEVSAVLTSSVEDIKLMGLAVKWEDLHPSFFGYLETTRSVAQLRADPKRDAYERARLFGVPFEPHTLLSHIATHPWHAISALSVIAALITEYSYTEVEAAAQNVPYKNWRAFLYNEV